MAAHAASTLALARLACAAGDLDGAEGHCAALLRAQPEHEEGALLLAEVGRCGTPGGRKPAARSHARLPTLPFPQVMFRKEHYEAALFHFSSLLERKPRHYTALAQLVGLLRRAGRTGEVPPFLAAAERSSGRAKQDGGLAYCRGLHARAVRDEAGALGFFNRARKDGSWAFDATEQMVDIYLAPHAEAWGDDLAQEDRRVVDPQARGRA